jgi:2-C-methyl-D-erythritol 4-phosphate cytidylyltransferase
MIVAMILAGGTGRRFGAEKPKQFVEVFEKPVLAYTAEIFQNHPSVDCIEIVCHNDWKNYLSEMIQKFNLTKVKWIADGGKNFQDSVMNGMNRLKGEISVDDYVLVQYGASPFTSEKIVSDVIRVAREKDSAVSATPCYQLLGSRDGSESRNWIDREKCIQIACPYGFKFSYLLDVYKNAGERGLLEKIEPHTTSLIYALGDSLNLAYGNQTNIKITTRDDLDLFAGFVLASREKNRF